jgi:hypothetical protein
MGVAARLHSILKTCVGRGRERAETALSLNQCIDGEELSMANTGKGEAATSVGAPLNRDPTDSRSARVPPRLERSMRIVLEVPTRAD